MKNFTAALLLTLYCLTARTQDCKELYVDISKGTLNGISPSSSPADVKKAFPCFTSESQDGTMADCGGGVFFNNHHFSFFTGIDNINIRKGFTGKCSVELIGMDQKQLSGALGRPDEELKDDVGIRYLFYRRTYGCLVVTVGLLGLAQEFFMFGHPVHEVTLCI